MAHHKHHEHDHHRGELEHAQEHNQRACEKTRPPFDDLGAFTVKAVLYELAEAQKLILEHLRRGA